MICSETVPTFPDHASCLSMICSENRCPLFRIMLYHSNPPPERLVPAGGIWLATAMSPFPHHLLEGYRTFTSQRLPTEQSRYRELSERGQSPAR
jgi:carbonic anhydrase